MILGQAYPAATVQTDIYTAGANQQVTLRVLVCNHTAGRIRFRVSVGVNGAADANEQYIAKDTPVGSNRTDTTVPIVVSGGDVVRVETDTLGVSFTATGVVE